MTEATEVSLHAPFDPVPFSVVGPPDDRGVIGEIQRSGGSYEPRVMQALRRVLRPNSVAFDIGANIGVFALVMARLSPRGRVYAFEPARETFEYLVKNLQANHAGNVRAEQCAAYDATGTVQFVFSPAYPPGSFVSGAPGHAGQSRTVQAVRLDDYVERQGIERVDLIMVDAEGAEVAVLRGAQRTLAAHRPALLVEVNPVLLRRFGGTSFRELAALLSAEDHSLYSIGDDGAPARLLSERHLDLLLRREGVTDLLCLPRGRGRTLGAPSRGSHQLSGLEAEFSPTVVPGTNFLIEPAFELGPPPEAVAAGPGMDIWLTPSVRNTSPYWFSSDFLYYPVHLSYRWYDAGGNLLDIQANRGRFESPLAPGASGEVRILVRLPSQPGEYQLALTLVQENFAWFDDLDPALSLRLTGTVLPAWPPPPGA